MIIPNWMNANIYKKEYYWQYAWEFLRRNKLYIESYNKLVTGDFILGKCQISKEDFELWIRNRFKLNEICNPEINEINKDFIRVYYSTRKVLYKYEKKPDHIVDLTFDLTKSISEQLYDAKLLLIEQRKKHKIKPKKSPKTISKSILEKYLRVYDAKQASVKNTDIAKSIIPSIENHYPDYAGNKEINRYYKKAKEYVDDPKNRYVDIYNMGA